MIENTFGLELVDQLVGKTNLATVDAYTTIGTYDYKELLALVRNLHHLTDIPVNDMLMSYGQYLFPKLFTIAPDIIS